MQTLKLLTYMIISLLLSACGGGGKVLDDAAGTAALPLDPLLEVGSRPNNLQSNTVDINRGNGQENQGAGNIESIENDDENADEPDLSLLPPPIIVPPDTTLIENDDENTDEPDLSLLPPLIIVPIDTTLEELYSYIYFDVPTPEERIIMSQQAAYRAMDRLLDEDEMIGPSAEDFLTGTSVDKAVLTVTDDGLGAFSTSTATRHDWPISTHTRTSTVDVDPGDNFPLVPETTVITIVSGTNAHSTFPQLTDTYLDFGYWLTERDVTLLTGGYDTDLGYYYVPGGNASPVDVSGVKGYSIFRGPAVGVYADSRSDSYGHYNALVELKAYFNIEEGDPANYDIADRFSISGSIKNFRRNNGSSMGGEWQVTLGKTTFDPASGTFSGGTVYDKTPAAGAVGSWEGAFYPPRTSDWNDALGEETPEYNNHPQYVAGTYNAHITDSLGGKIGHLGGAWMGANEQSAAPPPQDPQ